MFRPTPPPPPCFDENHLPSFILGVVGFGASAVGVAVTGGALTSVLVLAVLSALCAAVAFMDQRLVVSTPGRADDPGDGDDGWRYRGPVDDDDRPTPPSGAGELFDWESFTQQFWTYVREREVSALTGRPCGRARHGITRRGGERPRGARV